MEQKSVNGIVQPDGQKEDNEYYKYQIADTKSKKGILKTVAYYSDERFTPFPMNTDILIGTRGTVYNNRTGMKIAQNSEPNSFNYVNIPKFGNIGTHRAMLMTYHPIHDVDTMIARHIDGIKKNNNLSNLEWITQQESAASQLTRYGEDNSQSKYTENEIRTMCDLISQGKFPKEIAEIMNIPYSDNFCNYISRLRTHRIWPHVTKEYEFPVKAKHTEESVEYICQLLEQNLKPSEIVEKVKEKFNIETTTYFIECLLYKSKKLSPKWLEIASRYNSPRLKEKLLTEDEVHYVCSLIEQGHDAYTILNHLGKPITPAYVQLLRGISNGTKWRFISQNYDVIGKLPSITPRLDKNLIEEICKRLEKGLCRAEIARELQIENTEALRLLIYKLKNHKVHDDIVSKYNI